MNNAILEALKGKSREERAEIFKAHKEAFLKAADLEAVNGGGDTYVLNPNSEEVPFQGAWASSRGYICNGQVVCH